MSQPKKKFKAIWLAYAVVVVLFLSLGIWMLKTLLFSEAKPRRKMTMITLVKPPPPPPPLPEEEPPPPEVEEKLIEPEPEPQESPDDSSDEPPAGENLGVDAEGSAGGDSFGLVGKKGGRSLIGGLGGAALLQKYAWYTRILQEQIRDEMRRLLEDNGGMPDGSHKARVRVVLDESGRVIDFRILDSSGSERMDQALIKALPGMELNEPPPPDMPLTLDLRISAKG